MQTRKAFTVNGVIQLASSAGDLPNITVFHVKLTTFSIIIDVLPTNVQELLSCQFLSKDYVNLASSDVNIVLHLNFAISARLGIDSIKDGAIFNVLEICSQFTKDIITTYWDRSVKVAQVNIHQIAKLAGYNLAKSARTKCIFGKEALKLFKLQILQETLFPLLSNVFQLVLLELMEEHSMDGSATTAPINAQIVPRIVNVHHARLDITWLTDIVLLIAP